ncbi:hypothetical protein BaRGS_00038963 [Batillaria attramentaria]|uniref:Uncharacterized protein n=1 Tax=Batillaria attramentaria TaxID=370345 RepID=A0ABD0J4J7_9CAEN
MDVEDFEWEPPSEAQMKLVQARRERSDRVAKLMGDYLLKGYKMLGITCPSCDTILLQDRQGANYCIAFTNQAAALAQARELQHVSSPRETSMVDSSTSHPLRGLNPVVQGLGPGLTSGCEISSSSTTDRGDFHTAGQLNNTTKVVVGGGGAGCNNCQRYVDQLVARLEWALQELTTSQTVEYSTQLCQLIKSCADAVSSVKSAFQS